MAVIGFFSYTDFLSELKSTPLWGEAVRVQQYHESAVADRNLPLAWYTFYVEAAVHLTDVNQTLVCRFVTGKVNTMGDHNREKLVELDKRNRRGANMLREALRAEGFTVRPGLIAAAEESKTEADPEGLWTFEDLLGQEGGEDE